jgi:DNA-binding PadR family transcriptional regulator
MKDSPHGFLPLAPATLHILLAVAGEPLHGYGIMQEVLRQSEGRYRLGPGTLYDNLQRLVQQGLVEEAQSRAAEEDSRRRYYQLTKLGRSVLSEEVSRLEAVIQQARVNLRRLKPRTL